MRLLHTADWQIGMRAAGVGSAGRRVRAERLAAARRVVAAADAEAVDLVLVAGDTFEDNAVDRVLVQQVADVLAGFAGPVYLLPGNHDPACPGSVWEHPAWAAHENLHVLRQREPIEVPGGVLYPCPLSQKHSSEDPTRWIVAGGGDRIAVGLAHGSVEGPAQGSAEHPIAREAAWRAGVDYLALGHFHSKAAYDGRMAYSGTHETTSFGERDSGNVLVVEIDRRGSPPRIIPLHTGRLTWLSLERTIRGPGDLARAREEIESLADPQDTLLELRLTGVLAACDRAELPRIEELAAARFLHARVNAAGLRPAPADDGWLAVLADGPLRQAARRLQQWADPAFGGPRPDGATPEVATRALVELYARAEGARSRVAEVRR